MTPTFQGTIATIEPPYGPELVIWGRRPRPPATKVVGKDPEAAARRVIEIGREIGTVFSGEFLSTPRTVIDSTLDDARALWTADVDGDGTDEVFAAHAGRGHRVAMYRLEGTDWRRTVLDGAITPADLRGGDLDGDGVPDIVAVGAGTAQVVWYRPTR